MMSLFIEILIMVIIILLSFLFLGIVMPVGYTLGCIISDKIESFLRSL